MDRNYNKSFRGLPTEIRLEIWKFTIPDSGHIQYTRSSTPEIRELELPKLQIQLLRLNRVVYNEVLPLCQDVIVILSPKVDCKRDWAIICQSLRSPIVKRLKIIRHGFHSPFWSPYKSSATFLSKFLYTDESCSLHTLIIDINEIDDYLHNYCLGSGFTHPITDELAIATLAAAFLERGLACVVRVDIGNLPEDLTTLSIVSQAYVNQRRYRTRTQQLTRVSV